MKLFKNLLLLGFIVAPAVLATPFEDDRQEFYVEGQELNETVESLNFVLCMAAAMRPDAFVNQGPYLATIYDVDCEATADASSDRAAATPTSAKSSSSAASASGVTASGKTASQAITKAERSDTSSPVEVSSWIPYIHKEDNGELVSGLTVLMSMSQTAGPSDTAPNGAFELRYNVMAGEQYTGEGAFIEASEDTLKYREVGGRIQLSSEKKANGDTSGVYRQVSWHEYNNEWMEVSSYYQYYISRGDKAYCRKLISASSLYYGNDGEVTTTDITNSIDDLNDPQLTTSETCYSTDRTKAQRNVHRYGVYIDGGSNDGERLELANSGFSLYADVIDNDGEPQRVHAWADYWGVWIEPEGRASINANTPFKRESFDNASSNDSETYNLTATDIRIEKSETFYLALNDLDGLSIGMYVSDDWWKAEFASLFGADNYEEYEEYEGYFEKDGATDGSGQFTFTGGVSFVNGYEVITLSTPITFSLAEWQTTMAKEWGADSDEWYFKEVRQMGVWSHDTRQWYDISAEALAAPTSATRDAGVRTETTSIVSASDITETLYCIRDCVDGAAVQQTFTEAVADEASVVSTPFANVGSFLKSDVTVTQVWNNFQTMSEATDEFWLTDNLLLDSGFKLGERGAAVTDFINGDPSLKSFLRIEYQGLDEYDNDKYVARFDLYGSLSSSNLNKLLSADVADPGQVPIFNLDIKSIPAAGESGSMTINATVISNGHLAYEEGDRAISAQTTVDYTSNGEEFVITIPNGATVDLTYTTAAGIATQASYTTAQEAVFGYAGGVQDFGSVSGQSGISWNVFQLFSGHSGIDAFNAAGIGAFFEDNMYYAAQVKVSDTSFTMEGGAPFEDALFDTVNFNFDVRPDSDLSDTQQYFKGEGFQGMLASEAYSYTVQSGKIIDPNGVELTKGAIASSAFAEMDDPNEQLQNVSFVTNDGWSQSVAWGIRTGQLVGESDLAKLECRKTGKDEQYEWHPTLGRDSSELRYCEYQLWEGGIDTSYSISLEATPSYSITLASTGEEVVISEPKTLYYTVPETVNADGSNVYGNDAGKRLRLEFRGHGDLSGIPGFVYDTATGEDLGEFIEDWQESYRYLNRFMLADGALVQDGLDSTVSYKVKALDGQEWLTNADGSVSGVPNVIGKYLDLYTMGLDDLLSSSYDEVVIYAPDSPEYIGEKPTVLLNDGKASVVHDEVVYTPTP